MKKFYWFCFGALVCVLVAGCFWRYSATASATPVSANGRLQVKGAKIVNSKGKPFVIKGVSTHGLSWYPQYVNKSAFASLKKRGVNTIRLAMYTEEYNGYCTGDSANRKNLESLIDQGVKEATALGMYVIIDWHILSDGNPLVHKKEAQSFFKKIAKKYNKNTNILFEICNEPNGNEGSWNNIKKYANAVIKTIRSVNKKAIIVVGTPTWSQDVDVAAAAPLKGSNIAYAFHFYASTHKQDLRNKLEAAVKKGLPVIVSEFGLSEASGNGYIDIKEANKWNKLMNQYKIGRVGWSLSNKDESSALLKPSCQKTAGWKDSDFSKAGKWLFGTCF
jgi:endoglucanase